MIKKISIVVFVLLVQLSFAQKNQKIGFIDRAYVLENIPEYKTAQSKLDAKINKWNNELAVLKTGIDAMKSTLANEKALLTTDLITQREESIAIKESEFKTTLDNYFGTSGDLFMLRKQLVKPIQDQIFNATQEVAKNKKYDFILEKAGNDIVMLYTNPKYDVSELVLRKIVKGRKKKESQKKKTDNETAREKKQEEIKNKLAARKTKQEQLKERIKKQNEAKAAKREAQRKLVTEKRAKRIAEAKAKKEALKNKKNKPAPKKGKTEGKPVKEDEKLKETPITLKAKTKEELRQEKIKKLKDRNSAKKAKKDSIRKDAAEKKAKRLAEIKNKKNKPKENKNN